MLKSCFRNANVAGITGPGNNGTDKKAEKLARDSTRSRLPWRGGSLGESELSKRETQPSGDSGSGFRPSPGKPPCWKRGCQDMVLSLPKD